MAFTTAQDFIDVWEELDAAYVTFPAIAGAGGDYTAPAGTVDTAGQFSDTVSQFPGLTLRAAWGGLCRLARCGQRPDP